MRSSVPKTERWFLEIVQGCRVRTEDLRAFFQIAETGSLTAASTALGVPKSTVSRRLSRLEDDLQAQLVLRTPRAMQLTELGQLLHRQGSPALASLDEVRRAVRERGDAPTGPLRISAPNDLATSHLGALLGDFMVEYPEVDITLEASNGFVDLIGHGFDVALRIHLLPLASVSSLRTRRLVALARGLYASPQYLEQHGTPRRPEDLQKHACLTMAAHARHWELQRVRGEGQRTLDVSPRFLSSDHHSLRQAAEVGSGIATLPTFLGEVGVCDETLVRVLPGWSLGTSTLSALWPTTHHTSPRIRAFVDAAAAFFNPAPWVR